MIFTSNITIQNFAFECIRWSSIFTSAARGFWNIVSRQTFTQCTPTTITAEIEDMVSDTPDNPYNPQYSLLRKSDKTKSIVIPNGQGLVSEVYLR